MKDTIGFITYPESSHEISDVDRLQTYITSGQGVITLEIQKRVFIKLTPSMTLDTRIGSQTVQSLYIIIHLLDIGYM